MKNLTIFTVLLFVFGFAVNAQSLERQVIASAGGFSAANGVSLSFTVGEPVIETAVSGSVILTQGFQQPEDITTGIATKPEVTVDYTVFPNPTDDKIFVELTSDTEVEVELALFDISGRRIVELDTPTRTINGRAREEMDMSQLAPANYILTLSEAGGKVLKSFKVQKIN